MGLIVSSIAELAKAGNVGRSLYIYLLGYGWPSDDFEETFYKSWSRISERSSETGALIIRSEKGVHFANEVLSWHSIYGYDAENLLPALLITESPPSYFAHGATEESHQMLSEPLSGKPDADLLNIILLPLRNFCKSPADVVRTIESVLNDLNEGRRIKDFRAVRFDVANLPKSDLVGSIARRVRKAIILQPNINGVGVDLAKLFESECGN